MTVVDPSRSGMTWAVRDSLVRYIGGAGGTIEVGPPASATDAGFSWPAARAHLDAATGVTRIGLDGWVRLSAHEGLLEVPLRDLELVIGDGAVTLSTLPAVGRPTIVVHGATRRVDAAEGITAWVVDEPALHADVVDWFGGQYPAGTPFAPLVIVLAGIDAGHGRE